MLIAICVAVCSVSQSIGLWLIWKGLGTPEKTHAEVLQAATMEPTLSSDYGGLA